jgi:hypothetical protein
MAERDSVDPLEADIIQLMPSESCKDEILQHLSEVLEGDSFRSSPRAGRFVTYIVEQALASRFDSLKERVIGVELFGRSATYDTGEDAIVRVTACDVRKRLLHHYERCGTQSRVRLSLPIGSYVPEFTRLGKVHPPHASATIQRSDTQLGIANLEALSPQLLQPSGSSQLVQRSQLRLSLLWTTILLSLIAISLVSWDLYRNSASQQRMPSSSAFFWAAFFRAAPATNLITSDPNVAEIQDITGGILSVSDYANRNYYTGPKKLTPEQERICREILSGDKEASFDSVVAANVATLAVMNKKSIVVHAARNIQFPDLKTDNNFIFLGSPRSDPWSALFNNQLDFQLVFDKQVNNEIVHNVHPRPNEQLSYIPTAVGRSTGQSYAIIALVRNPDQKGQVLLLAGATNGGTEAAGKVVTDPSEFLPMLRRCGIDPSGPIRHFELLLHLNTMVGSVTEIDYVTCHTLPTYDTPGQP